MRLSTSRLAPFTFVQKFYLRILCGAGAVLWYLMATDTHAEAASKNVLVLYSNHAFLKEGQEEHEGITKTLGNDRNAEVYSEFLDAKRFPGPDEESRKVQYLRRRYADKNIDVAIVSGLPALSLAIRYGNQIFPGATVVYLGIRDQMGDVALPANFIGVDFRLDVARTAELALSLQPDARKMLVVSGTSILDKIAEGIARSDLQQFAGKVSLRYLSGLDEADLDAALARADPNSIVLYLSISQNGVGTEIIPSDPAIRAAAASAAPVYGIYGSYIGTGMVGAYAQNFETVGEELGRIARLLVEGAPPKDIVVDKRAAGEFMVDWRQIQRWGLSASNLPAGTQILHRPPSLWEEHRTAVLAALAVLAVQFLLISTLLLERRHRRKLTTHLSESEQRYRNVVETQSDLICRYLPDTTLTFVNDAYCSYFQRSRAELIGTKFADFIPEAARPEVFERVQALTQDAKTQRYEHEVLRPNGEVGWQHWTDRAILDGKGSVAEIQAVGRDLTELHRAEAELRERRKEVTHLTRVAMLGELSGALAHELNQPLTAILANAQAARHLIRGKKPDLAGIGEILDDIVADDDRAGKVIKRLRSLLKKESADRSTTDVNRIVMDTMQLLRSELIDRRVAVDLRLARSLPPIEGDSVQIQQILINLILNGCEAVAGVANAERRMTITSRSTGNDIEIAVSDRGAGIDPLMLDRIFDPFVTTRNTGLGLGLSICRTIVEAHLGRIWATNNPNRGATITFSIPAHKADHQ
ncbi:ATP-binding protein [Mesorhizobium sp. YR577]|uniref:ATP-binding protein n=1 Tax=Mesorhizobium sp. YR577 TaxID=1884373 RepID=UPI0008E35716|nr:ATP-binding protein [Mesorhizobium sp. YR577]SFU22647.1 PAS domain S-box-containing protein [Mesorhizobium sp. YR577]